jgi:hypothetical protein
LQAGCANTKAFALLSGRWAFTRQISNGLTATGRAVFLPGETDVLSYREDGTLSSGGQFTKQYRYSLSANGIVVVHADSQNEGAPFQTLQFRTASAGTGYDMRAEAANLCGEDNYDSAYRLTADHIWMRHIISGPKKDYQIETAFQRANGKAVAPTT